MDDYVLQAWRCGRKVGRTIYVMTGELATEDDPLIGVMDTPALAAAAVIAHNSFLLRSELGDV